MSVDSGRALSRYFKLWPLVSYRREADHSLLRALALWPLKQTPGIERNWAPLWSLYTRERAGDVCESELLWGLCRYRRSPVQRELSVFPLLQMQRDDQQASRSWSLLYGLVGMERKGVHRAWQLLYFLKFGGRSLVADDQVNADREKSTAKTGTDMP